MWQYQIKWVAKKTLHKTSCTNIGAAAKSNYLKDAESSSA
jgi:hypothetical protein